MQTLDKQLEDVQEQLSTLREHPLSEDNFTHWRNNVVTKTFFLELQERYLENLMDEPVVKSYAERLGEGVWMSHTNPVEETAINSAIKSGRGEVLEALLTYEPENLDKEVKDDE